MSDTSDISLVDDYVDAPQDHDEPSEAADAASNELDKENIPHPSQEPEIVDYPQDYETDAEKGKTISWIEDWCRDQFKRMNARNQIPVKEPQEPEFVDYFQADGINAAYDMETPLEITNIAFNQDASSLTVCHDGGFFVYDLQKIDRTSGALDLVFKSVDNEKTIIVERLFKSSLAMIVSAENSRRLRAYHFQRRDEILNQVYTSAIKAVKLNRQRIVVCLEEAIHIHNVRDMRIIHMIRDTPSNREGIMDLCSSDTNCYLAYPGSVTHGHVNVFDADRLTATCIIAAHDAPLAALKFNSDGTKLATASIKGTVIRVFAVVSGERLFEFTRGIRRSVTIHSLAFSIDSKYLCSSSNTETVHVFSLERADETRAAASTQKTEEAAAEQGWLGYITSQASNYLPQQINEIMLRETSFATARLPMVGKKTSCAMPRIGNKDYLAVTSTDGFLFCYSLPTETGECTLVRQYKVGPEAAVDPDYAGESRIISAASAAPAVYPSLPRDIKTPEGGSALGPGLGTTPPVTSSLPGSLKPGSVASPPSPVGSDSGSSVGRVSLGGGSRSSGGAGSGGDDNLHHSTGTYDDNSDDEDFPPLS
uniref:WD_REPEATS_REGION domain-containing protein n=1 Tax=Panagrellus redivivus TaxID=6233 RepID=A0A7E4VN17_PANRE